MSCDWAFLKSVIRKRRASMTEVLSVIFDGHDL